MVSQDALVSLSLATVGHLEPVQLLFHPVKGVIPYLIVGAHGENRLPGRPKGSTMNLAVCGGCGIAPLGIGAFGCQTRREFAPNELRNR